eukprot:3324645-Pyramimonas_sp.AAC.1
MLLALYRCPRAVQAFGSLSREVTSFQGMPAGCSHANALMQLLLHRVVARFCVLYRNIRPRVRMDDASFQWVGDSPRDSGPLLGAVTWFCRKVFRLGPRRPVLLLC